MKNMFTKKGFTLIEILIVVAIIGILASVVVVGLGPAQKKGRDSRRVSDLRSVQNALELYYGKNGSYPVPNGTWTQFAAVLTGAGIGTNQIPNDPTASRDYVYSADANGTTYVLAAQLEDATGNIMSSSFGYGVAGGADLQESQTTLRGITDTRCGVAGFYCLTL